MDGQGQEEEGPALPSSARFFIFCTDSIKTLGYPIIYSSNLEHRCLFTHAIKPSHVQLHTWLNSSFGFWWTAKENFQSFNRNEKNTFLGLLMRHHGDRRDARRLSLIISAPHLRRSQKSALKQIRNSESWLLEMMFCCLDSELPRLLWWGGWMWNCSRNVQTFPAGRWSPSTSWQLALFVYGGALLALRLSQR